jgi:hypothetical protein
MNIYIKEINLKWHDMFRPLLDQHQVSVSVKALNLYPTWIHIMGCLCAIQHRTCNKPLSVMYYLKAIGLRLDESLRIWLNVKLKLKLNIIKIKMTIYMHIFIWIRLAVTTTKWFIVNQYFTIEYLFPATCLSPHGTIITQWYMYTSRVTELLIWIHIWCNVSYSIIQIVPRATI